MVLSGAIVSPDAFAGKVELTTYYPAPYGEYKNLKSTEDASFATTSGTVKVGSFLEMTSPSTDTNFYLRNTDGTAQQRIALGDAAGGVGQGLAIQGSTNSGGSWQSCAYFSTMTGDLSSTFYGPVNVGTAGAPGTVNAGSFLYFSDARLKENVVPVSDALEKIERLTGVNFVFKNNPGVKRLGLIAQDVEPVVPEIVSTQADGMKSVDYAALTGLLIEGMKAQQREIDALKERVAKLEAPEHPSDV